jgi:hypothetical protein
MKAKLAIVGVFILAVVVILAMTWKGGGKSDEPGGDGGVAIANGEGGAAKPDPAGGPVEFEMLYSSEKKEWFEAAAAGF